ncbi:MAG: PAS domain-containing protein [Alphaproteobacteria bacterium]|nr:PAS domain-containing protein [Alphaproteobacteria bacterium]
MKEAYALLFANQDNGLVSYQFEETRTALPVLAAFHVFAGAAVLKLCHGAVPAIQLFAWGAAGLALLALIMAGFRFLGREHTAKEPERRRLAIIAPLVGVALGLYWGWADLGFSGYLVGRNAGYLEALMLSMALVGLLCLVRLPITALVFAVIHVVLETANDFLHLENGALAALLIGFATLFGSILVIALLNISFRNRYHVEQRRKRDGEVINLLLNDLGAEIRDWLWETTADGKLAFFSPKLAEVLGVPAEELPGMAFISGFFGRHAPALASRLQAGEALEDEIVVTTINGVEKHWLVLAKPLQDENGVFAGHRGVARDVTTQRMQDRQIAKSRDEAQRANEAKSQFLAVISHELRTPINAIVGFSEVLSAGQGENLPLAARREYLGTILESAKHLQGLINDILEATRIERGNITLDEQPTDAAELVEIAVKIVRDQATNGKISIVARVIDDVVVTCDLTRLKQVILNVLTNAIKFSPEGGVVQVDMNRSPAGDLLITVRDAGIGISAEDAERVFEPFVQAENGSNRRFGGMGLGLAIARRIARLHGGELTLAGAMGVGTEAKLVLPSVRVRWPAAKKPKQETVAA